MVSSASAIAVTEAAEATINREEPSVRQALMARHGHPRAPLMTCGDIFRIIIALFIPPSGRLHSGGIDAALLDQPGDLSLCSGRAWFSGVVPVSYTHLTLPTILLV